MKISNTHNGGNIELLSVNGDTVMLSNELRDTTEDWFYWSFCCEDALPGTVHFEFDKPNRIGYYGAAVSTDLVNWRWTHTKTSDKSFTYTFKEGENKLYFAHNMMYLPDRFYNFIASKDIHHTVLCKSEKGNDVPCLKLGNSDKYIVLTARHHACEATGSYVLEGVLEELISSPLNGIGIFCVPFVDYDGVVAGDQGKARYPHDHNRDYCDQPIYQSTAKIMEFAKQNEILLAFDFHSPWHQGGRNDAVFIVEQANFEQKTKEFSALLKKEMTDACYQYNGDDNIAPGIEWNNISSPSFSTFMRKHGAQLSFTLETAYFGRNDNIFSTEKAVELGHCFARAIKKYVENI